MNTPPLYAHDAILRYFEYAHLPQPLQDVSKPFCELAHHLHATLRPCAEKAVALRKLLEGKDAAVRAALPLPAPEYPRQATSDDQQAPQRATGDPNDR